MKRLALAALVLAGCTSSSSGTVGARTADPGAHVGGELRVAIVRPTSIDPQLVPTSDTAGQLVVRTMCDSLLGGDATSRVLEGAVASRWRALGPASFQLTLRKSARFSDGRPVKAQDAVAALQRVVDPDVVSPQHELLRHVAGYQDVQDGGTKPSALAGVHANGNDSLQVQLDRDDSQFLYAMTLPLAIPVPADLAMRPGFSAHPVCSGPYQLQGDYTGTESTITLTRNPDYTGTRSSLTRSGRGWADRVVFTIVPSRAAALELVRAGKVDAAQVAGADMRGAHSARLLLLSATTGRLEYLGLPHRPPYDQAAVAVALSTVLDRAAVNDAAFHGARTPAFNLVPPTLPDRVLPKASVRTCGIGPRGDVAAAKSVLAKAGITAADLAAVPLHAYFNDEFDNAALIRSVSRQWSELGVRLTPVAEPFDRLLARGTGSGGFDGVFRMTATAEWPDQGAFVLPLITPEGFGTTNLTGFNGTVLERQTSRKLMKAVPDGDQAVASLAVTSATCSTPLIPIAWYRTHLAVRPNIIVAANGGIDASAGLPELRELAVR